MVEESVDVLLKADGGHLLLASGFKIVLGQSTASPSGGHPPGVGRSKQQGVSIFDQDPVRGVHARKIFKAKPFGQGESKLLLKFKGMAEGLLVIPTKILVRSVVQPKLAGQSYGRLLFTEKNRNYTKLKFEFKHKALAYMHEHYAKKPEYTKPLLEGFIKVIEKMNKLSEIEIYTKMLESLERDEPKKKVKSLEFSFDESVEEWRHVLGEQRFRAFTASSSFVENIRYDRDLQQIVGILGGVEYTWCGVPERIFDAWEGAGSKGAFSGREVKGQFDC